MKHTREEIEKRLKMDLDDWQWEALQEKGNLCICSGRQVGKSTIIAIRAGESAVEKKRNIMVIAATERQAYLLFEKVLAYLHDNYRAKIKTGRDRPTKHTVKLTNGSQIHCLPTGDSGYGIRGYTIDDLYADEAHFIKEDVWAAVTPMLATTGGRINLLSTPFGTTGYFYKSFHSDNFKAFHVSTEDVANKRKEPQRTYMLNHLLEEKKSMTKLQYQQEYLGLFVGGLQRFFPDDLINSVKMEQSDQYGKGYRYLGVDIARLGGDEIVLLGMELKRDYMQMFMMEIPDGQKLTDTARLIIHKDKLYDFKKIYIDDGGIGFGVYDILLEDPQTKRKVVGINNARREVDRDDWRDKEKKKPLMKIQLYQNLKNMMEQGQIKLWDEPRLEQSLRSILIEETDNKNLTLHGSYDHIVEALVRACWAWKSKHLNIFAHSF